MTLGVFGGSFDPPHVGHAIVARYARERLGLDRVVVIPAARPPHKPDRRLAPAALRLAMIEATFGHDAGFTIDTSELDRAGPSFTVDTLRAMRRASSEDELVLLIGSDQAREFWTWREPEAILALATVAVLTRADGAEPDPERSVPHVRVDVPRIDLSSSEIRRRVEAGLDIRHMVPDAVRAIIETEGLYRAPALAAAGNEE